VPFYVQTGKRLAKRVSEIVIRFRRTPHMIFRAARSRESQSPGHPHPARRGISLIVEAKEPGPS
jgi:glucose-6-phosphate 1-dehydrogenase